MATLLTPFSRATWARATPWKASDGTVRNRKSLSSRPVITGEVEAPEICGTPLTEETLWAIGMVTPEDRAPTMPLTFSRVTSFFAASTPAWGLVCVSPTTTLMSPPAALISSAARLMPFSDVSP